MLGKLYSEQGNESKAATNWAIYIDTMPIILLLAIAFISLLTPWDAVEASEKVNCWGVLAGTIVKIGQSNNVIRLEITGTIEHEKNRKAEAKLVSHGKVISSVQFDPIDTPGLDDDVYGYTITGRVLGDKGFSKHPKLIGFKFEYPACDFENGEVFLVLQNNKLSYGLTASASANEQIVCNYHCIFPNDKNGKPDRLTIVRTFRDAETGHKTSNDQREIYSWNGEKFKNVSRVDAVNAHPKKM